MADEELTVEDYKEVVEQLNEELDEAHNQIRQLEKENIALSRMTKTGDGNDDALTSAALEAEVEELQEKLTAVQAELAKSKDELADKTSQLKIANSDKLAAEADVRKLRKKVEELETAVTEAQEDSKVNQRKSQETSLLKANTQKNHLMLLDQNEELRKQNKLLLDQLENEKQNNIKSVTLIATLEEEKEQLELIVHNLDVGREDLELAGMEMEKELEHLKDKLQASMEAEAQWEIEVTNLEHEFHQKSVKMEAELSRCNKTIAQLEQQAIQLKDATLVGEKQREIDILTKKLKEYTTHNDALRQEVEVMRNEKSQLAERLVTYDERAEEQFYDKLSEEKEKSRMYQAQLEKCMTRLNDEETLRVQVEKENKALQDEVTNLSSWKTIYEKGHALQELTKHQKKMKEDMKRLMGSLEQMSNQLNETIDAKELAEQAFRKLKEEVGKDPDFEYPEYILEDEMKGQCAKLRAQVHELEDQICALEEDSVKLRIALKNQAGSFGETGFKYAGMSSDQLLKVNEFAMNLRDGKIVLPVDDKSNHLTIENKKLKEEIKGLTLKVERYEQELSLGTRDKPNSFMQQQYPDIVNTGRSSKEIESEMHGVREDLARILKENGDLKSRLAHMQEEITILLRQQIGKTDGSTDNIAAMLLASNESLMRELHEIRTSSMVPTVNKSENVENKLQLDSPVSKGARGVVASKTKLPPSGRQKNEQIQSDANQSRIPAIDLNQSRNFASTPMSQHQYYGGGQGGYISQSPGFSVGAFSPTVQDSAHLGTPSTPHGKNLLTKTIANMNLPPEEWADELKELNGQVIECVEQLFEREQELEQQKGIVTSLEEYLVQVKQQLASVYFDYTQKATEWEAKEKALKNEATVLLYERDDLKLKLKRISESMEPLSPQDADTKCKELTRKLAVYEVNEAILARKFSTLSEQLKEEQTIRQRVEEDFVEMEGSLKRRILFLEQYKADTGPKLLRLQSQLDVMVPQGDYLTVQNELENLRQDHIYALRRELDTRIHALDSQEKAREIRELQTSMLLLQADLTAAKTARDNLTVELEHQKQSTQRALSAIGAGGAQSSKEFSSLVSEMARYRGDASRLEVELVASNHRSDLLEAQLRETVAQLDATTAKLQNLEERNESIEFAERAARKEATDTRLKYEGGLGKEEAERLKKELHEKELKLIEVQSNAKHLTEMAEIATQQAESLAGFRDAYCDEIKALREHTALLESRTDDDLIIGRLQRHLMATKTAYKAFVRKYQHLRGTMRQREIVMRVLEHRLDQRETAALKSQEANRLQISALTKALESIYDNTTPSAPADSALISNKVIKAKKGNAKLTIGQKLESLSNQIVVLAAAAESSNKLAEESEAKARRLENECQDLKENNTILHKMIADMKDVIEAGGFHDGVGSGLGGNAAISLKKQQQQAKAVAARLLALTEEIRTLKLNNLQNKREISVLQQDKKHLKGVLARVEDDLRGFEEGRAVDEGRALLGINFGTQDDPDNTIEEYLQLNKDLLAAETNASNKSKSMADSNELPFKIEPSTENGKFKLQFGNEGLTPEELMSKLESVTGELMTAKRELSTTKRQIESGQAKVIELQKELDERNDIIIRYERSGAAAGKGPLIENADGDRVPRGRELWLMREEQEKLQEAATATIGSMRALLEEKNRTLEKYRQRIEQLQSGEEGHNTVKRNQSLADRRAEALLQRLEEEDRYKTKGTRSSGDGDGDPGLVSRLLEQMERADEILAEREKTVMQLEQKLAAQSNKCERAELRCASALTEMENMKSDLITLSKQLQASEHRCMELARHEHAVNHTTPTEPEESKRLVEASSDVKDLKKKISEMQKVINNKDEKIKSYRGIIVRLKEEFIKSEEEHALSEMSQKTKAASGPTHSTHTDEDLEAMRSQIGALRDGLKKAKDDLDSARKGRETLVKARQSALEENEKLEQQIGRAEAQASAAQEALQRCRRDLEESRKREVKLREKMKEIVNNEESGVTGKGSGGPSANELKAIVDRLQNESELLRSQNIALRRALAGTGANIGQIVADNLRRGVVDEDDEDDDHNESKHSDRSRRPDSAPPGAHRLGTSDKTSARPSSGPSDINGADDVRHLQHIKWEAEKKLQKRIATLEKRLQEKMQECDDAQAELRRQRELNQQQSSMVQKERDKAEKSRHALQQQQQQKDKLVKPEDIAHLEDLQSKLFALEEENEQLRRRAMVQLPNEILLARRKADALADRLREAELELEESEEKRKRIASGSGNTLRDSEDRFLKEERIKDELQAARRHRMELEATILERDGSLMELRFDVESKTGENDRLRRRVRELEAIVNTVRTADGDSSALERGIGNRFVKDRDAEGVIEGMRKVVDKLKSENDRLRKGSGASDNRIAEYEKRIAAERKKSERLESELTALQEKVKGLEDGGQKLAQRQQQISSLRKQLKDKEDIIAGHAEKQSLILQENDTLKRRATESASRLPQLELQLASTRANNRPNSGVVETKEVTEMRKVNSQLQDEIQNLRNKLAESARDTGGRRVQGTQGENEETSRTIFSLNQQIDKLAKENAKLKNELSAFDLEFFEEIENLKYAHAEAVRKLRVLERQTGQR